MISLYKPTQCTHGARNHLLLFVYTAVMSTYKKTPYAFSRVISDQGMLAYMHMLFCLGVSAWLVGKWLSLHDILRNLVAAAKI